MAKKGKVNKALLNRRWGEINDILAELANLHVWPIDRDIADLERALLEELDSIEYEAGLDYLDRA